MLTDDTRQLAERIGVHGSPPKKPLAGYLRLTSDRDGRKIGYEVQQRAILAWCEATGETIGEWYQDRDLTAADRDVVRPDYERMLKDIESGKWGGIAVWRLDRLVRLTREFERVFAVVEDAKAFVMSIEPLLSTKDDMGKFVIRLLVMLAEMEIAAMKARGRAHQRAKAEAGKVSGGGIRPFGFEGPIKDGEGRIINQGRIFVAHVPEEAALIREAARRFAWEGESLNDIVRDWLRRGVKTASGTDSWTAEAVYRTLSGPRMVGLRSHTTTDPVSGEQRTDLFPAEWEPILDQETWDRIRALKVSRPGRGRPYSYLLTGGLALCGNPHCGRRMIGSVMHVPAGPDDDGPEKHNAYVCDNSLKAKAGGACGSNKIYSSVVEEYVVELIMARLEKTPELIDQMAADAGGSDPRIATALDTIKECDRKLAEFATLAALPPERGGITTAEWMAFRTAVWDQRQAASSIIEAARATQTVPTPVGTERDNLRAWFDALALSQRRAFVRAHVRAVIILKGRRGGSPDPKKRRAAQLGRVKVLFADAKKVDGGGQDAGVTDLDVDPLLRAHAG